MKVSTFNALLWIFVGMLHLSRGDPAKCEKLTPFSEEEKKRITHLHNKWRNDVALGKVEGQPPAANMLKMWWNEGLADMAQIWANTCRYEHSKGRAWAGECLALGNIGVDIETALSMWFDEHKVFTKSPEEGYVFDLSYGHYSQVVWWDTDALGCARSKTIWKGRDVTEYVCHFRPFGNYANKKMYLVGEARSKCPEGYEGRDSEFPGLCVGPKRPSAKPYKGWKEGIFQDSGPPGYCERNRLDDEEKKLIVRLHNKYRNKIALGMIEGQKPAANMMKLWWNDGLAVMAQIRANKCTTVVNMSLPNASENIVPSETGTDVERALSITFEQHKNFKADVEKDYNSDFFSSQWAIYFTMMVWAETNSVGCGRSDTNVGGRYSTIYVCHYRPPSNVFNKKVYLVGPARSKCPEDAKGQDSEFPGLCVGPEPPRAEPYEGWPSDDSEVLNGHPQPNCFTFKTLLLLYFSIFYVFQLLFPLI